MRNDLYNILKETPEYILFKKQSRVRSIVALLIIAAFWAVIIFATDFNNIDDVSTIYFGLLALATLFLVKYAYNVFFKKPSIVAYGTITDIREKRRTVNEENRIQTRVSYQYLVHCDGNDDWGIACTILLRGVGKSIMLVKACCSFLCHQEIVLL